MDFRCLSRRELQALCKKNKIPANITNIAMADALAALPSVEGLEEFLRGEGSGVPESPMREEFVNSENPRTALRTSTRRKTVKDEPVTTRSRRAAAGKGREELENSDLNVALTTPSLPSGRRRTAAASSACKKVNFQPTDDVAEKEDDDLDLDKNATEKTPVVPKSQKKVAAASTRRRTETRATEQRGYSTRRSVRLLEATMGSLSLSEDKKTEPITVDMSFDEMLNSSGPVKGSTNLEVESKKPDESESKLVDKLELEIDNQEKNELESEVEVLEVEPETDLESSNCFAETVVVEKSSETEALDNNMNVKCSPEVEEANEASKDYDVDLTVVEPNDSICELKDSVEESTIMNSSVELLVPHEEETETQVGDVLTSVEETAIEVKVDDLQLEEDSLDADIEGDKKEMEMEMVAVQPVEAFKNEDVDLTVGKPNCESEDSEEESPITNNSEELLLPHEEETETQVDDVLSNVEESAIEAKVDDLEFEEESLAADNEVDKKVMEMVSVEELEEDISEELEEDVSEGISDNEVDKKEMEDMNVKTLHSQPIIPIQYEEEALVGVSVQPIPSFASDQPLASQFPRPVLEPKSPPKVQTSIKLLIDDNSDVEDEDEKDHKQANSLIVEDNDLSLRQLKKMFKEKLQLKKKKMDNNNNNTKVVGEGKVRTALQPLPENRMAIEELEKKF